ncbi:uncharacterized protein EI90DRAFT_2905979 [Cantharellus anzutake]|uniref:uncharacterized protein n=1 Tax=Cantharellus anzutake TaxID=1750568 RepID=UPI001904A60A|nr:uncharacterized protein EI90DRAFT_2905979 [Cantharellus anzutake]KAF8340315.1 hypothetical protein EI90DRAFT_2905979 [Cantharellus anzutake]
MVIEIENDQSEKGSMLIAQDMLGKKVYYGWPFLQEGLVVAVSDEFTCHELDTGGPKKIVSFPQDPDSVSTWKRNAFQIEELYSKRYAVLIGLVEVLLHVRPLKGERLDDGALVKDYEAGKEVLQAVQLALQEVISEDPRFLEKGGTPIQEEYPIGTKVIFLGEHAYGVAAQVVESKEKSLSVILAFFPSEASDPEKFTNIVRADAPGNYFRSGNAASMVGLSALALSRITSSLMVMTTDAKVNIGLCLKFEARGRKVMDYSRKGERGWEFSYRAIQLIRQYLAAFPDLHKILDNSKEAILRSSEALPEESNPDFVIEQMAAWLKSKGVQDFEQVPLDVESVSKSIIDKFERLADSLNATKSAGAIKKAKVQGIPRQAILKPSHAIHRLNHQRFSLGDRVVMAQDSGGVPLCARGVVVGISNDLIDVVWDMQIISGTTLNGRCSDYRGSSVPRSSCLNLKDPQFCVSTKPRSQPAPILKPPPRAATGPHQTSLSQGRGGQPRASPGM